MSIEVIKLVTNEEIIADITVDEETIGCKDPMLVAVQDGRLVFIPYMQYTSAHKFIQFKKKDVMFIASPVESLVDDYVSATTQIVKPRKSITASVP
jgi:hypothetical protein